MRTIEAFSKTGFSNPDRTIPEALCLDHGSRPSWLLTPYADLTWIVLDTKHKKNQIIRFDIALPNRRKLEDYPNLLESIRRVTYGIRTGPLMEIESGAIQRDISSNLLTLVRWMTSNDIFRFEELTPADVREYANLAAFGVHNILNTEGVLTNYLQDITAKAGIRDGELVATTRRKAIEALPTYRGGPQGHQIHLHRGELLRGAGLDGLVASGHNPLTILLDNFERKLGLDLDTVVRRRLARNKSLDDLDNVQVTEEHLRRFLMSFDYLYRHRRYLSDAVLQNPFPATSPRAVAKRLGKSIGRTQTIPIRQAATMIERSIRWVLDYAPDLLSLKDFVDSIHDQKPGTRGEKIAWKALRDRLKTYVPTRSDLGNPYPILPTQRQHHEHGPIDPVFTAENMHLGMSLPSALRFLMIACAVVIAAFSARRASEILSLKADCIHFDEIKRPWMHIYIVKTEQFETLTPVPQVVVSAIEVLEKLSARARNLTNTSYIFQMNLPGTNKTIGLSSNGTPSFRLSTHLRAFGFFLDIPTLENGDRWTFKTHQFRRFFAILYTWIYELGDWGALSYHLRHFDPEMTRRYVSDTELGHILALANKEHAAHVIANAALGRTNISGNLGTRLKLAAKRLYDRMALRIHVVPERVFIQRLTRFAERTGVSLHAMPWGFCGFTHETVTHDPKCVSRADVKGQPVLPDFTAATPTLCHGCYFGVRSEIFLPFLEGTLAMHKKISENQNMPKILRNASSTLILTFSDYIASLNTTKG